MSETVLEPPPEPDDDPEPWCLSMSDGADEPSPGPEITDYVQNGWGG